MAHNSISSGHLSKDELFIKLTMLFDAGKQRTNTR